MATAGYTEVSDLAGNFKETFEDNINDLIEGFYHLQQDLPWDKAGEVGKENTSCMLVRRPHGFDYKHSGDGVTAMPTPIPGVTVEGTFTPSIMIGRDWIGYDAILTSAGGGKKAFTPAFELIVLGLLESAQHRLELDLLYGAQSTGLGVISAINSTVITISTATWASGIWESMIGAQLYCMTVADGSADHRDSTTGTDPDSYYTITAVDTVNRTITVDAETAMVVGDSLFLRGQADVTATNMDYQTMSGIRAWLTDTTLPSGVSSSTYPILNAPIIDAGSTSFAFDMILDGCSQVSSKGGNGKMCGYVNPGAWKDAMYDLSATVRRNEKNTSEYSIGAESIKFVTNTGVVEIKAHPCVREGEAYVIPVLNKTPASKGGKRDRFAAQKSGAYVRSGVTDITFMRDGKKGSGSTDFFRDVPDYDGCEIRIYSSQYVKTAKPGRGFIVQNIVNS